MTSKTLTPAQRAYLATIEIGASEPVHRDHRARLGFSKVNETVLNYLRMGGLIRMTFGGANSIDEKPANHLWLTRVA